MCKLFSKRHNIVHDIAEWWKPSITQTTKAQCVHLCPESVVTFQCKQETLIPVLWDEQHISTIFANTWGTFFHQLGHIFNANIYDVNWNMKWKIPKFSVICRRGSMARDIAKGPQLLSWQYNNILIHAWVTRVSITGQDTVITEVVHGFLSSSTRAAE
jgi:hypothetical protein